MIKYIDYFVPDERISVATIFDQVDQQNKLPSFFETQDEGIQFFKNVLNTTEVSCAENLSEIDLIDPVLNKFFEQGLIRPSQVDLIILIDDQLDRGTRMSNFGHYIQHTYALKKANLMVLSGNHCSNIEHAIVYAENMLKLEEAKNILILAVNKIADPIDRLVGSYAIMGDAASIAFLSNQNDKGIQLNGKHVFTNGILYDESNINKDNSLVLLKNYMQCLSGLMKKNKLKAAHISKVIIQNANPLLATQCLKSLGFAQEQIFTDNLGTYGHLDCIDFLVNLKALTTTPGTIIAFGIGSAGSYIGLYLENK